MSLNNKHKIYFIGIGGIGMSALARYFNALGKEVSGYDKTDTELTHELEEEGIAIHYTDLGNSISEQYSIEDSLIVYTPAIPKDHGELNYFKVHGFELKKRSEILGLITQNTFTIGVAGTHGKTSTSSIIAHILTESGKGCNAFLGGIATNYNSNLLLNSKSNTTVVEADEFDRSFLTLHPDIAVITSTDADHLDIYGEAEALKESFRLYAAQIKDGGLLIHKKGLEGFNGKYRKLTYSIDGIADVYASRIEVKDGTYIFDIQAGEQSIKNIQLGLAGKHNVENAVASIAVAIQLGIDLETVKKSLASFKGIKRRFEFIINTPDLVFIDDYAHHPTELTASISSAREMFPSKKIIGAFQPHLYSRTRDFVDEFARSLSLLDELLLLEIYPARELPIEGVNSQWLLNKIKQTNKALVSKEELLDRLKLIQKGVVLNLGAGDIGAMVNDMKHALETKHSLNE